MSLSASRPLMTASPAIAGSKTRSWQQSGRCPDAADVPIAIALDYSNRGVWGVVADAAVILGAWGILRNPRRDRVQPGVAQPSVQSGRDLTGTPSRLRQPGGIDPRAGRCRVGQSRADDTAERALRSARPDRKTVTSAYEGVTGAVPGAARLHQPVARCHQSRSSRRPLDRHRWSGRGPGRWVDERSAAPDARRRRRPVDGGHRAPGARGRR